LSGFQKSMPSRLKPTEPLSKLMPVLTPRLTPRGKREVLKCAPAAQDDGICRPPLSKQRRAINYGTIADLFHLASDVEASPRTTSSMTVDVYSSGVDEEDPAVRVALSESAHIFASRSSPRGTLREYDHIFLDDCCAPLAPRKDNIHLAKTALRDALVCANAESMRRCAALVTSWLCGARGQPELYAIAWATRTLGERLGRGDFDRAPSKAHLENDILVTMVTQCV
jgi:hypothetical protein